MIRKVSSTWPSEFWLIVAVTEHFRNRMLQLELFCAFNISLVLFHFVCYVDAPETGPPVCTLSTAVASYQSSSRTSTAASHTLAYLQHSPPCTPPKPQPKTIHPHFQTSSPSSLRTSPQSYPKPQPYLQSPPPPEAQIYQEFPGQVPTKFSPQTIRPTPSYSYIPPQTKVPPQTQPKPLYIIPNHPQASPVAPEEPETMTSMSIKER